VVSKVEVRGSWLAARARVEVRSRTGSVGKAVSAYGRVVGGREGVVLGRRGEEEDTAAAGDVGRATEVVGARVVPDARVRVKLPWVVLLDRDLRMSWSRWSWCW